MSEALRMVDAVVRFTAPPGGAGEFGSVGGVVRRTRLPGPLRGDEPGSFGPRGCACGCGTRGSSSSCDCLAGTSASRPPLEVNDECCLVWERSFVPPSIPGSNSSTSPAMFPFAPLGDGAKKVAKTALLLGVAVDPGAIIRRTRPGIPAPFLSKPGSLFPTPVESVCG